MAVAFPREKELRPLFFPMMTFVKWCLGFGFGISAGVGDVTFNKKGCHPDAYSGWFEEYVGSIGPFGGGYDKGHDDLGDDDKRPGLPSGTQEYWGGLGKGPSFMGLGGKYTWCRYWLEDITYTNEKCCY
jgi:hypothetical protein